jgi:hypothetical protein
MQKEHVKKLIPIMEQETMDWDAVHHRLAKKQADAQVLAYVRARAEQSGGNTAYMSEATAEGPQVPGMQSGALVAEEQHVPEPTAPTPGDFSSLTAHWTIILDSLPCSHQFATPSQHVMFGCCIGNSFC